MERHPHFLLKGPQAPIDPCLIVLFLVHVVQLPVPVLCGMPASGDRNGGRRPSTRTP